MECFSAIYQVSTAYVISLYSCWKWLATVNNYYRISKLGPSRDTEACVLGDKVACASQEMLFLIIVMCTQKRAGWNSQHNSSLCDWTNFSRYSPYNFAQEYVIEKSFCRTLKNVSLDILTFFSWPKSQSKSLFLVNR